METDLKKLAELQPGAMVTLRVGDELTFVGHVEERWFEWWSPTLQTWAFDLRRRVIADLAGKGIEVVNTGWEPVEDTSGIGLTFEMRFMRFRVVRLSAPGGEEVEELGMPAGSLPGAESDDEMLEAGLGLYVTVIVVAVAIFGTAALGWDAMKHNPALVEPLADAAEGAKLAALAVVLIAIGLVLLVAKEGSSGVRRVAPG